MAQPTKGLEFPHVVVADGGWRALSDHTQTEEERRVYYVACTRARETLTIMVRKDRRTPFTREIAGGEVIDRTPRESDGGATHINERRYAVIDPTELFLSYAASMAETSAVQSEIRRTKVGDLVRLVAQGRWIHIETAAHVPIAALSEAGRREWATRLNSVRSATVTAMVRRTVEQEGEAYRTKAQVSAWEFPIVEVCWIDQPNPEPSVSHPSRRGADESRL